MERPRIWIRTPESTPRTLPGDRLAAVPTWLVAACLLLAAQAQALVGDSRGRAGLDGSLRLTGLGTANYAHPLAFGGHDSDGLSESLLRLVAAGKPWGWLSIEGHAVESFSFSTFAPTGAGAGSLDLFGSPQADLRYRAFDAGWTWADANQTSARMWLDRLQMRFTLPYLDVTVGRQAISLGKAYFWNPLDVFLPFDPRQVDREYKPGVDAVRVDIPIGAVSGLNLIAGFGRERDTNGAYREDDFGRASWCESALLGRGYTNLGGFDLSLQGGKVSGGAMVGAALSGEIGPVATRAEASYTFGSDCPEELADSFVGVLGVGHRFDNTLDLEAEYLFNGAADPGDRQESFLRVARGTSLQVSQHVLGLVATYELLPILHASLALLVSLADGSGQVQPGLTYSISDEADFLFGALIPWGARPDQLTLESEFGTYPTAFYLEMRFYF